MSLSEDFRLGAVPDIADLKGDFVVKLVTERLPAIRFFSHFKSFSYNITRGMGFNSFLGFIKVGRFRVEMGRSDLSDGLEVLKIIYDTPENPFFIRPLVDELRQICPGTYLGRGIYSIAGRKLKVFYFTVTN